MRVRVIVATCLLLALCGCNGLPDFGDLQGNPKTAEIEAGAKTLDAQQAKELRVWADQHDNVWDARVHSLKTCPFLSWTPNAAKWRAGAMSDAKWGEFLHDFFKEKHKEEGDCKCKELLAP
ncbi:MAG TPA: hypothetical protein VNE39_11785 [Planctomycetota bacterium]|nr:hypothetical protein [Planctomycetota bacterium]